MRRPVLFDLIQRIKHRLHIEGKLFDDPYKVYIEEEKQFLKDSEVERKLLEIENEVLFDRKDD